MIEQVIYEYVYSTIICVVLKYIITYESINVLVRSRGRALP